MAKVGVIVGTWDCLSHAKFCIKKSLTGIYPFEQILYQKLPILAILAAVSPHFIATTIKLV